MESNDDLKIIVENGIQSLTRSDILRNRYFRPEESSDQRLIELVAQRTLDPSFRNSLAAVSRLLRLMHGMLTNQETGEGFVDKFSQQWLLLAEQRPDAKLDTLFDELENFYESIQMFCAAAHHGAEEPLLIGLEELKSLTREAYEQIKADWFSALKG